MPQHTRPWLAMIPEADLRTYRDSGFLAEMPGSRSGRTPRLGLLVIDCTWSFCGSEGLTLEQAIAEFPTACGPAAWDALPRVAQLLAMFRRAGLPIVFTHSDVNDTPHTGKATKSTRPPPSAPHAEDFPPLITPLPSEWVLAKTKASAFFGTPLTSYLVRAGIDKLVVCGVSTSGCVRASVVDGFSHGFAPIVVDDCCFDRSEFAHAANLFDMQAKYATVLSLAEIVQLLPNNAE
jgi:maleamate amidohydrolase